MLFSTLLFAVTIADPAGRCETTTGIDIDPHTAGLGWAAGDSIADCCSVCSSAVWWNKGCRFYTFSKGRCWLKANNASVVKSPTVIGGHCTSMSPPPPPGPPPPPAAPWPKSGGTGDWIKVGPHGIGDDIKKSGESGTLADAVSPASNPMLIYAGGKNNGASSGVLKSTDGGTTWVVKSKGIWDTRINSLGCASDDCQHVYVSAGGGIYETFDGAETWTYVNASHKTGGCYQFKNGTIGGEKYIFASCDGGVANVPAGNKPGGEWNVIGPGGWGRGGYLSLSEGVPGTSVLGGCLGGHVFVGTVVNTTHADWNQTNASRPCVMLALNPNNADHWMYTYPPMTYQTVDGGKSYESLNHSGIFHCGIDRVGNLYTAAMEGFSISRDCGPGPNMKRPCHWLGTYDNRTQRRTGKSMIRGAHDYQRIPLDFGGGVSVVSDQGLFILPKDGSLELIKANGNMSNNIVLGVAVSKGDGEGKNYIVNTVWDWAPLGSWDSGEHWPSWQLPEDGGSGSCIGEGGGSYGMGSSNHMLLMHHHNYMASAVGGKNLTRFIPPGGVTLFGPTYEVEAGTMVEPTGAVYAPMFRGALPWNAHDDKSVDCSGAALLNDLGVHTNYSCVSAVDLGTSFNWYPGVTAALWRGDTDKHCLLCKIPGNSTTWNYKDEKGAITYVKDNVEADRIQKEMLDGFDMDKDGRIDEHDFALSMKAADSTDSTESPHEKDGLGQRLKRSKTNAEKALGYDLKLHETPLDLATKFDQMRTGVKSEGSLNYVIKNFNYGQGMNFSWTLMPPHLAGLHAFQSHSANSSILYAFTPTCLAESYDTGDTWTACWNKTGLEGLQITGLVWKNTTLGFALIGRNGVPYKTLDGGDTWKPLNSAGAVAKYSHDMLYSWTGKTLAMSGSGGALGDYAEHQHAGYLWTSTDDGETWEDHSGNIVTLGFGMAQWYENKLYCGSMGEGAFYKTLE